MFIKIALFCLGAIALATGARAEEKIDEVQPPTLPLVAPVPEFADWTVSVKYPMEVKSAAHHDWRFSKVHSTRTGKLRRDLITSREGIESEHWLVDSLRLWMTPEGEVAAADTSGGSPSDDQDPNPSAARGFPGIAWIKLEHYTGVVTYKKQRCYHYAAGEMEAWIDLKTKLPAAYERGGVVYRFKFNPAPSEPLTMPAAYQSAWDQVRKNSNRPS